MNYVDPYFFEASAKSAELSLRLSRAEATNNFLADVLKVVNEEKAALRDRLDNLLGSIYVSMEDAQNAPAGVGEWLKAFGVYSGSLSPQTSASDPPKPIDPRSEALGRAFNAPVHGNAPGLPPFDE